jgi:hypothetical protein
LGIFSTGRRITGVNGHWDVTWHFRASDKGVSFVPLATAAVGRVGHNMAVGVLATGVDAWVLAFFVDASLVRGTFTAEHTLWATIGRTANVVGRTRAHWPRSLDLTN